MDEKIVEHLKLLNKYLLYLRDLGNREESEFVNDFVVRASAERFLQVAIESAINVGNRILALIQFHKPVTTPESYADIFLELAKIGALPSNFVETMVQMVKFRNRLVHIYWEIDPQQVFRITKDNLPKLESFINHIIEFLKREKLE